ncbi:MAG: diguanylate cyclase [Polyangiales bacterium]
MTQPPPVRVASAAAARIVQAALQPDCSAAELAKLAALDPQFALRVLSVVNSPAFALSNAVDDVGRAASLLGVRGLKNLALSLIVTEMVPSGEAGQVLFANSLRRALAARAIAKARKHREVDPFFTTGLFLETGLLVTGSKDLNLAGEIASSPAAFRLIRERAAGEPGHPVQGAELAKNYSLPQATIDAIAHHHDDACPEGDMASIAWCAERIAGVFEGGNVEAAKKLAHEAAEAIGLSADELAEIYATLPGQVALSAEAFQQEIAEQPDLDALAKDAARALTALNAQYEGVLRQLTALIDAKEALEQELRDANELLSMQATTDQLTSLPNKRAYTTALHRDLARAVREQEPLSLIVMDIDHFKSFNDTWGHAVGDDVLRKVGEVLGDSVRTGDFPARYGGEEFVVVLPHTGKHGARAVAERIRKRLEAAVVAHPDGDLSVTASFGIATTDGRIDADSLFVAADSALYDAKKTGRNRVCLAA